MVTHTFNPLATLVAIETWQCMPLIPVVHAFNPSPREDYKMGGDSSHTQSILRFLEAGSPFQTEVEIFVVNTKQDSS
ncbi:hypothetical protein LEMLEM_LOCUS8582 [Lemmus lemmus]